MSDDRLQVGVIVFSLTISLVISMCIPILAPDYEVQDYETLYSARQEVQSFTGASMTNQAPWELTGIFTPYESGAAEDHVTDSGWLYGESITVANNPDNSVSVNSLNKYSAIRLDPNQKSSTPLGQGESVYTTEPVGIKTWYKANLKNGSQTNNLFKFLDWLGADVDPYVYDTIERPTWSYTGYRYEFTPLTKISTDGTTLSAQDARLSVVWYSEYLDAYGVGSEGLSGGLVLMNSKTNAIIANITMDEIIGGYVMGSMYSTSYRLDFNGTAIDFNIRFDPDQLEAGTFTLDELWTQGYWTMAVTAVSAANFMDIAGSTTLSTSVGSILDTYSSIFTLDLPNVPTTWSIVLWIVCILPLEVALLMFYSRFGIKGAAVGILANVLLGVL